MTHRTRTHSALLLGALLAASNCALIACNGCGTDRDEFVLDGEAGDANDAARPSSDFPDGGDGGGAACGQARNSQNPLGCEYFVFGTGYDPPKRGAAGCMVLFVSNPNDEPARLSLTWRGAAVDLSASARLVTGSGRAPGYVPLVDDELPPDSSAVIALIDAPSSLAIFKCPFPAVINEAKAAAGMSQPPADTFHLVATLPVAATYFTPLGAYYETEMSTATALRSAESWSRDYIDIGTYAAGRPTTSATSYLTLPSFTGAVSGNPTTLTFANDAGQGTIVLDSGKVELMARDDLFIGTRVSGDRPFGLFTGSEALQVPFGVRTEEAVLQAVAPPSAWGSEYAAVKFPDRLPRDPAIWRFVALEAGTTLEFEPAPPDGAPGVLNAGELALLSTSADFVVRSQDDKHPFHLSQLMPSDLVNCEKDDAGDLRLRGNCQAAFPQLLTTVPAGEFGLRNAFVTEPFYPDTSLIVIRRADDDGIFHDVTLDCAGVLTGWRAVGLGDRYQTTRVALSNAAFEPQTYGGGTCDNGAHSMRSEGLFTVAVWAGQHSAELPSGLPESYPFASNYSFNVPGRRADVDGGPTK